MDDTIFALSSGSPPAAIAVVRLSGPGAPGALIALAGRQLQPRRATVANLRDPVTAELLDRALVLSLPRPGTATGEDMAELHLHGGRAVVGRVEQALAAIPGLRKAAPGEFTRRAFVNGRLDLAEAEGLADLLSAETELQRQAALGMAAGAMSRLAETWRRQLLELSAAVEFALDFADEDDAGELPPNFANRCSTLAAEVSGLAERPSAELLRDGFAVVLAGPPNSGKSTLFNALTDSEAAITSPVPGTTRDLITRAVALEGVPFRFVDTAGLRDSSADEIEQVGMQRALGALAEADLVLWLGPYGGGSRFARLWEIAARQDCADAPAKPLPSYRLSAVTGVGLPELRRALIEKAQRALPRPGEVAVNQRQRGLLSACAEELHEAAIAGDLLIVAEHLRSARARLDALLGRTGTEDMLDSLFARFCIGK